jgi:hypothetical protein
MRRSSYFRRLAGSVASPALSPPRPLFATFSSVAESPGPVEVPRNEASQPPVPPRPKRSTTTGDQELPLTRSAPVTSPRQAAAPGLPTEPDTKSQPALVLEPMASPQFPHQTEPLVPQSVPAHQPKAQNVQSLDKVTGIDPQRTAVPEIFAGSTIPVLTEISSDPARGGIPRHEKGTMPAGGFAGSPGAVAPVAPSPINQTSEALMHFPPIVSGSAEPAPSLRFSGTTRQPDRGFVEKAVALKPAVPTSASPTPNTPPRINPPARKQTQPGKESPTSPNSPGGTIHIGSLEVRITPLPPPPAPIPVPPPVHPRPAASPQPISRGFATFGMAQAY